MTNSNAVRKLIPVKGYRDLVRDERGVIHNINKNKLEEAKRIKENKRREQERQERMIELEKKLKVLLATL